MYSYTFAIVPCLQEIKKMMTHAIILKHKLKETEGMVTTTRN